jgi:hypothetical protein
VDNGAACAGDQGQCTAGGCLGGTCGKVGEPCCGGGVDCTAPFTACVDNLCMACGGLGQRCCEATGGRYCGAPYVCGGNNTCTACGGADQPCCPGGLCDAGLSCNEPNSRCR